MININELRIVSNGTMVHRTIIQIGGLETAHIRIGDYLQIAYLYILMQITRLKEKRKNMLVDGITGDVTILREYPHVSVNDRYRRNRKISCVKIFDV